MSAMFLPVPSSHIGLMIDELRKIWNLPNGIITCENKLGDTSGFGFSIYGMVARLDCIGYESQEEKNKKNNLFTFMTTIFPGNCGMSIISSLLVNNSKRKTKMGWWALEWAEYLCYIAGYSRVMATIADSQLKARELLLKNDWQEIGRNFINRRSGANISTFYKDLTDYYAKGDIKSPFKMIEKDGVFTLEKQFPSELKK